MCSQKLQTRHGFKHMPENANCSQHAEMPWVRDCHQLGCYLLLSLQCKSSVSSQHSFRQKRLIILWIVCNAVVSAFRGLKASPAIRDTNLPQERHALKSAVRVQQAQSIIAALVWTQCYHHLSHGLRHIVTDVCGFSHSGSAQPSCHVRKPVASKVCGAQDLLALHMLQRQCGAN